MWPVLPPGEAGRLRDALAQAIGRSVDYFLRTQHPDGYWWGELESNVTMAAEYLMLTHFLGVGEEGRWRKVVNYLRRQARPDGTWAIYYGGPSDLNATVESYFAMKLAGVSAEDPLLQKARAFILSQGGVPRTRVFTKLWLALFGQWDWAALPAMPPEFMFLPSWFPINLYEFASWARATVVPILIIWAKRPVCAVPEQARLDELFPGPKEKFMRPIPRPQPALSWRGFFWAVDRLLHGYEAVALPWLRRAAIREAEKWILARQEADGAWGGIQPPWIYSLIALKLLGYPLDHPVMKRGLEAFEGAYRVEDEEVYAPQACISPVWDTALAMIGLLDAGLPPDHEALVRAARWLLKEQVLTGGDWQVKVKGVEPGGWSFEFDNDVYPDVDDTAEVMMALHRTRLPERERKAWALARGLRWVLGMQSSDGGWGAFDKDNTRRIITHMPFCDFGEVLDYPTEDVTAHVVEMLGLLGYDPSFPPVARALRFLRRRQEADGPWWGRWGVNYIYGTGAVLPALRAIGEDMGRPYVRRAVRWLLEHQNPDGGWGESCASYDDPALKGRGESTASQTAWALMALVAAAPEGADALVGEALVRGARYLVETQQEDGTWEEPYFTGTGFPSDFYINYHLYRNYWPLMALGRIQSLLRDTP